MPQLEIGSGRSWLSRIIIKGWSCIGTSDEREDAIKKISSQQEVKIWVIHSKPVSLILWAFKQINENYNEKNTHQLDIQNSYPH